jgi:SRSO17 transposase
VEEKTMTEQQLLDLEPALADFLGRFLGCCRYAPTFSHFRTYVRGLLSDLPRKSTEPIALKAGTPVRTLQEFLKDHAWDFASVRDLLAAHCIEQLPTAADPQALGTVGVIDETSAVKAGDKTPGVQRQYLGCVGKVENGIVTVHLAVAKGRYKTLIDFDLFLPKSWSDDRPRCRAAGIPDELVHRPKWSIALEQIDRATGNGVTLDWLCFDEEYGKSPAFIRGLHQRGLHFVGEVPRTLSCLVVNRQARRPDAEVKARTAEQVVHNTVAFREQDWRVVHLERQTQAEQIWRVKAERVWLHGEDGWSEQTYWLIWASNDETGEEKFFLCNAPENVSIETMVRVAFKRWNVEHCLRVAKTELGFSHFEGRNYVALMRHMSLCLVGMAFVASKAEALRGEKPGGDDGASEPGNGSGGLVLAGEQAGQHGSRMCQKSHRIPPETQPGGATVSPEAREPTHTALPKETPTSKTKTNPSILSYIKVALYC